MQLAKRKSINIFLTILMFTSIIVPASAFAYDIKGDSENPTLTIHKFEQDPNEEYDNAGEDGTGLPNQTASGEPLEGVEFTLTQTDKYNAETDEWTAIDGTPFTVVTDSSGKIVIDNIELGRYKVEETDGPPHVNLNKETFFVDIPMTSEDGNTLNYDVHIYPKNETIRGAVELFKIDGEVDGKTGLAGVVFDLYSADDELIEAGLTTNAGGYIRVNGLAYGDYYFVEVEAPEDYVLFGQKLPFSIIESGMIDSDGTHTGTVVEIDLTNYQAPAIVKTVENSTEIHETNRETEFTYNLAIALPEDIAEYDEFIVTDILDDRLNYTGTWYVAGADENVFEFNENGQTLTWTVVDFAALDGVEKVVINFNAVIKGDAPAFDPIENDANIDFTNESGTNGRKTPEPAIVIPVEGSLTLIKQDRNTKDNLPGASFELRNLEGDVVVSGTTDDDGIINWTGLDYGVYQLVETKAPEGYRLLTKPIDVTINGENNEISLTVNNTKSGWELPKTGGIGTTLFTLVGSILMGIAILLFFRRRRQEQTV